MKTIENYLQTIEDINKKRQENGCNCCLVGEIGIYHIRDLIINYNAFSFNEIEKIILFLQKTINVKSEDLFFMAEAWKISFMVYKKLKTYENTFSGVFIKFSRKRGQQLYDVLRKKEKNYKYYIYNPSYGFIKHHFIFTDDAIEKDMLHAYFFCMQQYDVLTLPEPERIEVEKEKIIEVEKIIEIEKNYKNNTAKQWHDKYHVLKRKIKKL